MSGGQVDGAIAVTPDQQGRYFRKPDKCRAEEPHVVEPPAKDLENMVHGARNIQTVRVTLEGSFGNPRRIAIHAAKSFGVDSPGKQVHATAQPRTQPGLEEADHELAGSAKGIGRREENEFTNAMRMTSGQHHGNSSAVRVSGDVSLREIKRVHQSGDAVRGCFQACVQAGNPFRSTHVEEIDSVDARVSCKEANVLSPGLSRADQPVKKQQGRSGASNQKVYGGSVNGYESLFDEVGVYFLCH